MFGVSFGGLAVRYIGAVHAFRAAWAMGQCHCTGLGTLSTSNATAIARAAIARAVIAVAPPVAVGWADS